MIHNFITDVPKTKDRNSVMKMISETTEEQIFNNCNITVGCGDMTPT